MKRKYLNQITRGLEVVLKSRKDAFLMDRATDKQKARAFDALMSIINQDIVNGRLALEQSYDDYRNDLAKSIFDAVMAYTQRKVSTYENLISTGRAFLALAENNVSRETSDEMYNDVMDLYIADSGDQDSLAKDVYLWYRSRCSPMFRKDKLSAEDERCGGKEKNACRWCKEACGEFGD